MDFGWHGDLDILAAVTFLAEQPDVDAGRIGVVGMSMGGEEAIGAAAADPRISAVVAEGATGRTDSDKAWLSDNYGARGSLQEGIEWLRFTLTDALTSAHKPIGLADAIESTPSTEFLLIAGGAIPDERHTLGHITIPGRSNVDYRQPRRRASIAHQTRPATVAPRIAGGGIPLGPTAHRQVVPEVPSPQDF